MRRTLPFIAFGFVVLSACSGAVDQHDLLGGNGGGTSSSGGASSSGGTGVDAGSSSSGSSSGGTTSSSGGASSSGSTGVDSGTVVDASVDHEGPPDTGVAETSPPPDSFSCPPGGSACSAPEVCCATNTGQGLVPKYNCQATSKPCGSTASAGTPISCSASADCHNGEVCCGDNQNGFYTEVTCSQTCQGPDPSGQGQYIQFCDPAVGDCQGGAACVASQVLSGFNVCQ